MGKTTARITREYTAAELDELLEISSYEQLTSRPRFRSQIDSDTVKPVRILGFYPHLPEDIQCGRSGCRAHQRKGYLVECDDGCETNIGEECGEKILDVVWSDITGGFNNQWRQKLTLNAVRDGIAQAAGYRQRVKAMVERPLGVRWLVAALREFDDKVPYPIAVELKRRADHDDARVITTRPRTAAELDLYDADHAPPHIYDKGYEQERARYERRQDRNLVSEEVGRFVGLAVFPFDGRKALFVELDEQLQLLESLDADRMPWRERQRWEKWWRDVESRFQQIEAWLDNGIKFFGSDSNMALLQHLTTNRVIAGMVQGVSWDMQRNTLTRRKAA